SVEGIDAVFIGPGDLAASMGKLGQAQDESVQKAIADIAEAVHAASKPIGIIAPDPVSAQRYARMGFSFIAVCGDITVFRDGLLKVITSLPALKGDFIKPGYLKKEG